MTLIGLDRSQHYQQQAHLLSVQPIIDFLNNEVKFSEILSDLQIEAVNISYQSKKLKLDRKL